MVNPGSSPGPDVIEAAIYDREIAAGKSDAYARAYAQSYVGGYAEALSETFQEGFERGRKRERERLRDMSREAAIHGPESQRWLMARELDLPPADVLLADDGDLDGLLGDGSDPLPAPASCH